MSAECRRGANLKKSAQQSPTMEADSIARTLLGAAAGNGTGGYDDLCFCAPYLSHGTAFEHKFSVGCQWFAFVFSILILVFYAWHSWKYTCGWEEVYVCVIECELRASPGPARRIGPGPHLIPSPSDACSRQDQPRDLPRVLPPRHAHPLDRQPSPVAALRGVAPDVPGEPAAAPVASPAARARAAGELLTATSWLQVILIHLSNITGLNDDYSPRTMRLLVSDIGTIVWGITAALATGPIKVSGGLSPRYTSPAQPHCSQADPSRCRCCSSSSACATVPTPSSPLPRCA
jgi:hypothetical protein